MLDSCKWICPVLDEINHCGNIFLILGNARRVKVSMAVLPFGIANYFAQTAQEQSSEFCRQVVPLSWEYDIPCPRRYRICVSSTLPEIDWKFNPEWIAATCSLSHTYHRQMPLTASEDLQTSTSFLQVAGTCVGIPFSSVTSSGASRSQSLQRHSLHHNP